MRRCHAGADPPDNEKSDLAKGNILIHRRAGTVAHGTIMIWSVKPSCRMWPKPIDPKAVQAR